jgi:thioredoxin 1
MRQATDSSFADDVLAASEPVIVDFWAPWCKPCTALEPILEAIAVEHGLGLVGLNIDEHLAVPSRYGVLSLPTVILFQGGEPCSEVIGARPRSHFERKWASWLTAR